MRSGFYVLALALTGVRTLSCSPTSARPDSPYRPGEQLDVGIFYDRLAPYGEWVEIPDYGWSWAPRVERGWRPDTRGQWIMTDDGLQGGAAVARVREAAVGAMHTAKQSRHRVSVAG